MSLALWAPWVCLLGEGQTDRASSLHNRRFPEKGQRIQRHKRLLCCCPAAAGSCQSPQEPRELLGSPCYQPPAPLRGRKNGAGTIPARRHVPLWQELPRCLQAAARKKKKKTPQETRKAAWDLRARCSPRARAPPPSQGTGQLSAAHRHGFVPAADLWALAFWAARAGGGSRGRLLVGPPRRVLSLIREAHWQKKKKKDEGEGRLSLSSSTRLFSGGRKSRSSQRDPGTRRAQVQALLELRGGGQILSLLAPAEEDAVKGRGASRAPCRPWGTQILLPMHPQTLLKCPQKGATSLNWR